MKNREEIREGTGMTKKGEWKCMEQEKEALASKLNSLRQRPLLLDNLVHILLTTLSTI